MVQLGFFVLVFGSITCWNSAFAAFPFSSKGDRDTCLRVVSNGSDVFSFRILPPALVPGEFDYLVSIFDTIQKLGFPTLEVFDDGLNACSNPTATLCEGSTGSIGCSAPMTALRIINGFYGRLDSSTCPSPRSRRETRNTKCPNPGTKKILEKLCNGKTNCNLAASHLIFGDPCVNTYKYLFVEYQCEYWPLG